MAESTNAEPHQQDPGKTTRTGDPVHPLQVGPLRLPTNLVLAPMHRHTTRIFRLLCRRSGAALAHTEMLVPEEVLDQAGRKTINVLASSPEDHPLGVQLLPLDPGPLAKAVAHLAERGAADLVDLNFACPSRRGLATGRGGAMLRRPDIAVRLVETAVRASSLPVTAKFRLGWTGCDTDRRLTLDLALRAAEAGAVAVTLHGRSVVQGYRGKADWQATAQWADRLPIPVLGSGDLRSPEAVLAMLRESGCAGASLARGALGAPWIFRQTLDLTARNAYDPVTVDERRRTMLEHFAGLAEQYGEAVAVMIMRREGQFYVRGISGARLLRVRLQDIQDVAAFHDAVTQGFLSATP